MSADHRLPVDDRQPDPRDPHDVVTDDRSSCPTCGDGFNGEMGVIVHHSKAHGEKIVWGENAWGLDESAEPCPTCGDEFNGEMGVLVHHSKVHGEKIAMGETGWESEEPTEPCPSCGEKFHTPRAVKSHHKHKHGESIAGIEVSCAYCEQAFRRKPARVERVDRSFCSVECQDKWRAVNAKTGAESPSWKGQNVTLHCDECGTEFKRYKSKINTDTENFCSIECSNKSKIIKNIRVRPHERGLIWDRQRKRALRRDGFECQECGMGEEQHQKKYGVGIHVHHKRPARLFKTEYDAHSLDNLVSLCASCHEKIEAESSVERERAGKQTVLVGDLQ